MTRKFKAFALPAALMGVMGMFGATARETLLASAD